jgi:predicted GNAT superfamily acetyltransferase
MTRVTQSDPSAAALGPPASIAGVRIRPLRTIDDCQACVDLQREVWGWEQADVVPATLLHVVEYVGGLAAGAFDPDGTLLGFVFGVSGVRDGRLVHWSHMLAVRESVRNIGLGLMLKEYQRRVLADLGIAHIFWTFDPLMAKNAYINLNRLGAVVVDYVPDMYGTTTSPLHLGVATDRLVVRLDTTRELQHLELTPGEGAPILSASPRPGDVSMSIGDRTPATLLIEIPADVLDVAARSTSEVAMWRSGVRGHLVWALAKGYTARGVHRDAQGRSFYVLERSA